MKIIINTTQYNRLIKEGRAKPEDRDKIYEDERISVIVPLTHKGSCKYGAYTKWCVATPSNDEHFNDYKENGILIYFIINSPYPESDVKQYKFAYYHSFTKNMEYANGWYDMSDYHFMQPNEDTETADIKLIKFLIPEFVFAKVKEYIKKQKPIFDKKKKELNQLFADTIMMDKTNIQNTIVINTDWFIFFRRKPFDDFYEKFIEWQPIIDFNNYIRIYYFDRKKNKLYFQDLSYNIDISNENYHNIEEFKIYDIINNDVIHSLRNIFHKYFKEISKQYYRVRKDSQFSSEYIYLPPELITVNSDKYGYCRDNKLIVDVIKKTDSEYNIKLKKDNKIYENAYYNIKWGVMVCYDKERHNSLNLDK